VEVKNSGGAIEESRVEIMIEEYPEVIIVGMVVVCSVGLVWQATNLLQVMLTGLLELMCGLWLILVS
jgi:hypothetical protein